MSRDDGFRIADVDVGILDDPKVRQLVRATRDEGLVSRCLVGYLACVTSSWGRGERVGLQDAAPLWLTNLEELGTHLAEAGLLDADARVPQAAWNRWFGPAVGRRQKRQRAGRKGGLASHAAASPKHTSSNGRASLNPTDPSVLSVLAVPASPSSPSGRASDDEIDVF